MIRIEQIEMLRYSRDRKSTISVNIYEHSRLDDVTDLLERGFVKEGRPSTVAPYRRFRITSEGKKFLKEYEKRLKIEIDSAARDAAKMAHILNY